MIIEIGHFALVLALVLALAQSVVPLWGAARGLPGWMMLGRQSAVSLLGLSTIALLALVHAYALSDFSVLNVVSNSHTAKPLLYKLTAAWGNHEGSMLLWVWMLSLWGVLVVSRGKKMPDAFRARVLAVQGMLAAGFLAFILFASNPFARIDPPAAEGLDLNPLLQDPLLAIHPPFLYAGYVGFSISFCFAAAALIEKKADAIWAALLRPWALGAWVMLTGGIALGSFWAYYELGWGGFWFWDPVENASLLPWLAGTALLHSVAVLEKRGGLAGWTVFLAILAFSLSMLGTFLVRSGVLVSVHAFATDPMRGIFILALIAVFVGSAFSLYAARAPYLRSAFPAALFSRETALLLNNVFLFTIAAAVLTGTLYPVLMSALNLGMVSVGPPYYVSVLLPFLLPFCLLMGVAPAIPWQEGNLFLFKKFLSPLVFTAALTIVTALPAVKEKPFMALGYFCAGWVFFATLQDFFRKTEKLKAWRHLRAPYLGMIVGHLGFALLIAGATGATQGAVEKMRWMAPGDRIEVSGFSISYLAPEMGVGRNYNFDRAVFSVERRGAEETLFMLPEKRWYPVAEKETSETALRLFGLDVLYVVLGEADAENPGRWVVRVYYHPLIALLYAGAFLMALGGLVSMSRKRGEA